MTDTFKMLKPGATFYIPDDCKMYVKVDADNLNALRLCEEFDTVEVECGEFDEKFDGENYAEHYEVDSSEYCHIDDDTPVCPAIYGDYYAWR